MAEQDSKPTTLTTQKPNAGPFVAHAHLRNSPSIHPRHLLPIGLSLILLLAGCFGGGNELPDTPQAAVATSTPAPSGDATRSDQANAALTRVASSLATTQDELPTVTPAPPTPTTSGDSAQVPLPTVTPTIAPSPMATRTIELYGDATLRLQINSDTFESSGQPVTIPIDPRSYVLGGDTLWQTDEWCVQLGAAGLIFNVTYSLLPITEDLYVHGDMQLYDGFCGEWGGLGNQLATMPLDLTIPAGSTAQLAPSIQVQGNFLGLPNLLDISTGVALELTIRNPSPR